MTYADHILAVLISVAFPVYGYITWNQFEQEVARGKSTARVSAYLETISIEWALTVGVLVLWWMRGRSFQELGLYGAANVRFVVLLVVVFAGCSFLVWQWLQVRKLEGKIPDSVRKEIEPVASVMPHTALEKKLFLLVSLTAGICEEILCRGFLLWYAASYFPIAIAFLFSVLIFGLGHIYQGKKGVLKTAFMGAILAGIYVASGSLIGPIILHVIADATSGLIGNEVVTSDAERPAVG